MRAIAIDANEHGGLGSLLGEMQLRTREREGYDALDPIYILAVTDRGEVAGCARQLPTTGPTMLARTFPQLPAAGRLAAKRTMIESSRFCVDSRREGRGGRFLHEATLPMFAGVIEWSMSNSYIEIATATDFRSGRILQRVGWPMTRPGGVELIRETMSVDDILPADRTSFEQVYPPRYCSDLLLKRAAA